MSVNTVGNVEEKQQLWLCLEPSCEITLSVACLFFDYREVAFRLAIN